MRATIGVLAATLVLAAGADAKGPTIARVCGPVQCRVFTGRQVWGLSGWSGPWMQLPAPRPAAYYVIHLLPGNSTYVWAPARGLVRITDSSGTYWRRLPS